MSIPGLQIDLKSEVPVYRQIADGVRAAAHDGRIQPGFRLPPTRDLARQLGVNRNTVVAAYDSLASEGWVNSHTGKGTFLASHAQDPVADGERGDTGTWFTAFSRTAEDVVDGGLQSIYRLSISKEGISFVGSYPAGELMPLEGFRAAVDQALSEQGAELLVYGPTAGHAPLREQIAESMNEAGSRVAPSDVLVTNGAQQALALVFRTFLERGTSVVIEEPTYTGALTLLSSLGARPVGVPLDEEGIRPDLLEIALQRHRPGLIYVQPTFQNPTTRVMSEARRRRILELAARYRVPVVEDDWAGDLRLEGSALPTLHALDGGRHVIYLSTFSKNLMPGLRLGWVVAPPAVMQRLVELKRVQDCGTSPLLQAALHVFLRDGGLQDHLQRTLPAYRKRRDCMLDALRKNFPDRASWTRPEGGLFLWVTLPAGLDGADLFAAARDRGVLYSRGELFHSDGSGSNHLRLTYSAASPSEIGEGVATLGSLVRERLDRSEPERQETIEATPIL